MVIVDRHGLPLAVSTHTANHHEVTLVQLGFDCHIIEARPEKLTGDRAYDRDKPDEELRQEGIEMIAPIDRTGAGQERVRLECGHSPTSDSPAPCVTPNQ